MRKLLKKGQFWYYDFVLGLSIFSIALVMAFMFLKDNSLQSQKESESYVRDTERLSEVLLSEGIPYNWSADNVVMPGLLSSGYLDTVKAGIAANLSASDYDGSRLIFGIDRNYHIEFRDMSGQQVNITPIGDPGYNSSGLPEEMITIQRYIVLREDGYSKIIQMVVQTWD